MLSVQEVRFSRQIMISFSPDGRVDGSGHDLKVGLGCGQDDERVASGDEERQERKLGRLRLSEEGGEGVRLLIKKSKAKRVGSVSVEENGPRVQAHSSSEPYDARLEHMKEDKMIYEIDPMT